MLFFAIAFKLCLSVWHQEYSSKPGRIATEWDSEAVLVASKRMSFKVKAEQTEHMFDILRSKCRAKSRNNYRS
jgi:hypothetical protein